MKIPKRLSKEQQAAQEALIALLEDQAEADRRYNALADSHGGRVISTDLARFLDTRYRDTPTGVPRDLVPGWDLAWRYAQNRLERELRSRGRRRVVRFMAGGWGAGKTHALEHAATPDLAWDGTLSDSKRARKIIDRALDHGWRVEIAYVFRDIELALYGAIERAKDEGRSVPLQDLPGNHRAVQLSISALLRRYRRDLRVSFLLLHNTGAKGVEGTTLVIPETELAPNGALHYSQRYEDYYGEAASQIEALNPL
jgi:hypothetical protein